MNDNTRLFGRRTKKEWKDLRAKIIRNPNELGNWLLSTNLLLQRLETRYFKPIEKILKMRISSGEGFAVMTLICSLIEFLQSCYEGKTFVYGERETKFIYGASSVKFKSFLEQHEPFKTDFTKDLLTKSKKIKTFADDFYSNVRCGLLHEAATTNGWIIKSSNKKNKYYLNLCDEKNKIIYRDDFFELIKIYCRSYLKQILDNELDNNNQFLRDNFCRKMDSLCEIYDNSTKWWS